MTKQNQTLIAQQSIASSPRSTTLGVKSPFVQVKTRVLMWLGLRSQCCGAKIVTWHHDKFYCEVCEGWLSHHSSH